MASGTEIGGLLDWGVATAPFAGEEANGDLHLVRPYADGMLVAVLDALGHGPEAEDSARLAIATLNTAPVEPMIDLFRRCHRALLGRRGVVLSMAVFDARLGLMTWAGVGNVEGVLARNGGDRPAIRSGLVTLGGIVGSDLPEVRPQQLPVDRGNFLLFATDGIHREALTELLPADPPGPMAEKLLARHSKGTDDALILVARYRG
jgi:phosphoserine phosphatase RsbX